MASLTIAAGPAAAAENVFARAGSPVPAGELDRVLAGIASRGSALFRRAVEDDDTIPLGLLTELLTSVSALRAVLGFTPTPVNAEIYLAAGWAR